jgi:hypothetical protein
VGVVSFSAGLAPGCENGQPKTYPVHGAVRINVRPAVGANITLVPVRGEWAGRWSHRPFGKVGPDGSFQVSTFAPGDGAPAGEYVVTLYWPTAGGDADRLGGAHLSPDRSNRVTATVTTGRNDLPLDLTAPAARR